jgi:peptidoglycan-associated lipoprotein
MKNMKSKTLFNLVALGTALIFSGTGCRHTPQNQKDITGTGHPNNPPTMPPDAPAISDTGPGVSTTGTPTTIPLGTTDRANWAANSDILAAQTIHFDYDKSAIKSHEQSKVDAVADYLKSHPNVAVRVEGNCDERGTEEYNRSLGERRALAARERIVQAGIDPSRVDIITYGKDKPVAQEHNEAAFSKNRRDDFVVLTPPGQ